jgi:hypothetical protein
VSKTPALDIWELAVMATADPVDTMLDGFVEQVQTTYKAFILARTCHVLGSDVVDAMADGARVAATIGLNIEIEPIPVSELREFRAVYPEFVIEVFHGKLVQHWQDLLDAIFAHYVDLHLCGQRQFAELGTTAVKIDFGQQGLVADQIRDSLCRDFQFRKYAERQRLIGRLRDLAGDAEDEVGLVQLHVHIRNAVQHHQGLLHAFVFRELGCREITVMDDAGSDLKLEEGDRIIVSLPELDRLRRTLLMIARKWRGK